MRAIRADAVARPLTPTVKNMKDEQHAEFFDAKMPRWYAITALILRFVGFALLIYSVWLLTRPHSSATWPIFGFLIGILLLVLPSLPKAYIEQRNRIRGFRAGSLQEHLKTHEK